MDIIDKCIVVVVLLFIALAAISWIGKEFHALLAVFELLIGCILGFVIFSKTEPMGADDTQQHDPRRSRPWH